MKIGSQNTAHVAPIGSGLAAGIAGPHWRRYTVDRVVWESMADDLAHGKYVLIGLWAEQGCVHMGVSDPVAGKAAIATLLTPDGFYPSVARKHLPALRMERAIFDLFGIRADGCPDTRPWLDHGKWPVQTPLAANPAPSKGEVSYKFLPVDGKGLHQIPVGPIHAGIIEPGHFRFTANGETVVRLEERLGYVHKGVEKLFEGADIATGAKLAGRISGDSTVAYAYAYACAIEVALGVEAPARAQGLRALFAEIERIANHIGDIGAICNDAAFSMMHAHCGILREETLQLAYECFGHRLMMDRIIPGGVAVDITDAAKVQIMHWTYRIEKRLKALVEVYDNTSSLRDRTDTTGVVSNELVTLYGSGGYVGRASGRNFDARKHMAYAPYDVLAFEVPTRSPGDVNARVWIRIAEVGQSIGLIRQILGRLPDGALVAPLPDSVQGEHEGVALVEGFRGDILIWMRLLDGKIKRCYPRDPSWFHWPLLEVAIKGNIVADFPLCNKSFNCSYSGHDL